MTIPRPWALRRLATRLAGDGPRTVAGVDDLGSCVRSIHDQPGAAYSSIATRVVTRNAPRNVADWPHVRCIEPRRRAFVLQQAALYDDDGAIYERHSRRAVRETLDYSGVSPSRHPALALRKALPLAHLPGLSVFLGGVGGQTFYHFFIETLPQLEILTGVLDSAARLIVQGYIEPAKEAWLRLCGVRLPIVWLRALDHVLCDELAFCSRVITHYQPNPWGLETVRRLVRADYGANSAAPRFIWADRHRAHERLVPWESELVAGLPAPWEPVDFAQQSPADTIALCRNVAAFAGFHGAAFANLALCRPAVRVLEFYPQPKESWFPALSAIAGHHHEVEPASIGPEQIARRLADAADGRFSR